MIYNWIGRDASVQAVHAPGLPHLAITLRLGDGPRRVEVFMCLDEAERAYAALGAVLEDARRAREVGTDGASEGKREETT